MSNVIILHFVAKTETMNSHLQMDELTVTHQDRDERSYEGTGKGILVPSILHLLIHRRATLCHLPPTSSTIFSKLLSL